MFRKWYFSWLLYIINKFCQLYHRLYIEQSMILSAFSLMYQCSMKIFKNQATTCVHCFAGPVTFIIACQYNRIKWTEYIRTEDFWSTDSLPATQLSLQPSSITFSLAYNSECKHKPGCQSLYDICSAQAVTTTLTLIRIQTKLVAMGRLLRLAHMWQLQ